MKAVKSVSGVNVFARRRREVLHSMPKASAFLLIGLDADSAGDSPIRQSSDFYYLSGFNQTDAALLLIKSARGVTKQLLFCRHPNRADILWRGPHLSPTKAASALKFSAGELISDLRRILEEQLLGCCCLYYPMGQKGQTDQLVMDALKSLKNRCGRSSMIWPRHLICSDELLAPMRLIKDPVELSLIKEAARIAIIAHRRVAENRSKYKYEYQIEADLLHTYRGINAQPSFPPIVAAGANACVLHYMQNDGPVLADQGLLVDSGAEYGHYCSDITRTYFLSEEESPGVQAHKVVLGALRAACAAAKPGTQFNKIHQRAVKHLIQGLGRLGIIKENAAEALAKETYKRYFPHQTSHWIGLDVHDVGGYADQTLKPGMVFSVEPGLYFAPTDQSVAPQWRGIGVRLEDTVLMTETGIENMTESLAYDGRH